MEINKNYAKLNRISRRIYKRYRYFSTAIASSEHAIWNIQKLKRFHPDNPWFSWYEEFLKGHLHYQKIWKWIPSRTGNWPIIGRITNRALFFDRMFKKAVDISNNKKNGQDIPQSMLLFGNIVLPPPPHTLSEIVGFVSIVLDSLSQYLLNYVCLEAPEMLYTPFIEGPYESGNVTLEPGDIVIDAGANIGDFSALASVRECGITYAFEPIPEVIENSLSKTVAYNQNIEICPFALSDTNGTVRFNIDNNNRGAASFILTRASQDYIEVETITLDDFVKNNNIPRVDFIKADIEGAERNMLAGAQWVLKTYAPKLAICTYHLPDDPKVLEELILKANPNYTVFHSYHKLYAYDKRRKREGESITFS